MANPPMSQPTPSKPSHGPVTGIAVGVVLGVVGFAIIAGLVYFFVYKRRGWNDGAREIAVGPGHLASRVTPFYAFRGDGPRFGHTPGENMRVAHRRPDGGWNFSDPFAASPPDLPAPPKVLDLSSPPSPSSTVFTMRTTSSKKDKKNPGDLTTRGYIEESIPPPAYTPAITTSPRTSLGY